MYSTVYTIKFAFKTQGKDFVVSKLEGLWWFDESRFGTPAASETPLAIPRSEWEYRLLIRLPEFITKKEVQNAQEVVLLKKRLIEAQYLELFEMNEGLCVQVLHQGPFTTEPGSLKKLLPLQKNGGSPATACIMKFIYQISEERSRISLKPF